MATSSSAKPRPRDYIRSVCCLLVAVIIPDLRVADIQHPPALITHIRTPPVQDLAVEKDDITRIRARRSDPERPLPTLAQLRDRLAVRT